MKKVLFATTALIAAASAAAADVKLSGYGRFGVVYDENNPVSETFLDTRFRLQVDASATADNGLEFGARVRAQGDDGGASGYSTSFGFNAARLHVKTGGLTVYVGNVPGAIDEMPNIYHVDFKAQPSAGLGLTGLGYHNFGAAGVVDGYSSSNGAKRNGVALAYEMGDFSMMASFTDPAGTGSLANDSRAAVHFAYKFSGWTAAIGYQDSDYKIAGKQANDVWALSIGGDLGQFKVSASYSQRTLPGTNYEKWVIGGSYAAGAATTVSMFVSDDNVKANEAAVGLGVSHDLGGGVKVQGGIVREPNKEILADVGVFFAF